MTFPCDAVLVVAKRDSDRIRVARARVPRPETNGERGSNDSDHEHTPYTIQLYLDENEYGSGITINVTYIPQNSNKILIRLYSCKQ